MSDVDVGVSVGAILVFLALCLGTVRWIFRSGWKIRT